MLHFRFSHFLRHSLAYYLRPKQPENTALHAHFCGHLPRLLLCLLLSIGSNNSLWAKEVNVALVADGESEWVQAVTTELQDELTRFSDSQLTLQLPQKLQYFGDWQHPSSGQLIQSALNNASSDIVITLGLLSSDAAASANHTKPVIAATVVNPAKQGFPLSSTGSSGKRNLHYLMTNVDLVTEMQVFQRATEAKNVGVLAEASLVNNLPILREKLQEVQQQVNFTITPVPFATTIQNPNAPPNTSLTAQLIRALPADIDALFIVPQFQLSQAQQRAFINALNAKAIPTFSMQGLPAVEMGYLMGSALIPSPKQLARRLAVDIRDIALGRPASELVVAFDVKDRLSLNMETALTIDYSPPFPVLLEAELINELPEGGRELTLYSAVDDALKRNLTLLLAGNDYQLAKLNTKLARSALLPQLNANATWNAQDRDISQIRQTRTTSVGAGIVQSLYSESLYSSYTSSKFLETAEQAAFESSKLDVIELTARAYFNVLIAKTQLNIQRDNLKLTLANLKRAQFRYQVGATSRAEVLRFETSLGNDRQSITNAQNQYQQALNQLNRILQRPIQEVFQVQEQSLSDPKIFGDARLESFIKSPRQLTIFGNFLTEQAKDNSPELVTLRNQIKSEERLLLAAKRKRYVPNINLTADVDRIVDDSADPFVSDYDNDWSVGVNFSWTLWQGNRINAERSQAQTNLQSLRYAYQQTLDQIETNTRDAVSQASTSRININYASASANAAEQTLALVTDSYVRGKADYIDLIDAQSSYIQARLASANATYQHLLDLVTLQRAIGFFDFYVAPEQEEQWFNALNQYATQYEANP